MRPVTWQQGLPSLPPVQLFEPDIADDMLRMMRPSPRPEVPLNRPKFRLHQCRQTGTTIKRAPKVFRATLRVHSYLFLATDPRLVVVVSIDDPKGSNYYGGNTAAPAFAEITREAARILNIPPDEPETLLAGEQTDASLANFAGGL